MRSKCATSLEQNFALLKPSPSHFSGQEWSTYLLVAPKGAKTAGKCKWCFSCSMVGCRLKLVLRRRGSGLARGACGRFLEVSFFFSPAFIANVLPKRGASFFRSRPAVQVCVPRFQGSTPLVAFYHICLGCIEEETFKHTFPFSLHLLHTCKYLQVDDGWPYCPLSFALTRNMTAELRA